MDESSSLSAAELGISDVEYERILRDLGRRGGGPRPPVVDPPLPVDAPRPRRRRWPALAVLVLVVVVLVPRMHGATKPAYSFLETANGRPITYSSCRQVPVAIYPAGGPPDAEKLVREAVALLRSATGLDIVVTGAFGGYAPNWNFKEAPVMIGDPISVSWQDGDAIAQLTDDVAGVGGSRIARGRNGEEYLTAGTIALSRAYYKVLAPRKDHGHEMAVLLHEFGHVLGLGHVGSRHEIMYKSVTDQTSFGPGDLVGLHRVGHGPCV